MSTELGEQRILDIDVVLPNPLDPRGGVSDESVADLAVSVRSSGILQPLLVTPSGDAYHIVAGHRRRAAAALVGLKVLPTIIRVLTETEQVEAMLSENIQRKALTPLQEATAYRQLIQFGVIQADIARRLGVLPSRVTRSLRLLDLGPEIQRVFEERKLPMGMVNVLSLVETQEEMRRVVSIAIKRRMTVEDLDAYVRTELQRPKKKTGGRRSGARTSIDDAAAGGRGAEQMMTRSGALEFLSREGQVPFSLLRQACEHACRWCEEERHPEICASCPIPEFMSRLKSLHEPQKGSS